MGAVPTCRVVPFLSFTFAFAIVCSLLLSLSLFLCNGNGDRADLLSFNLFLTRQLLKLSIIVSKKNYLGLKFILTYVSVE